ncbi:MAG TPA: nucleotidyltransferase family protein [Steroidobacteraceae bacterium]|nr:nucleotidyltransferase family protein [Steroidobacteraceae bacterium]
MSAQAGLTALVLAGSRREGDPLAASAGVSHKALIPVGAVPMLERVVAALAAVPRVGRILVAIERPDIVDSLPAVRVPVSAVAAAQGPSASVFAVLAVEGTPLLVTTADHALLRPAWVEEFLDADAGGADALLALARSESVLAAAPGTLRTWLRFRDGDYSGCNLFLLRSPASAGIVALWQQLEADRKRPLALLGRLGFTYVLRYRFGWLTLRAALARLGRLCGARLAPVILSDGEAAIDVDKPSDLTLAREIVARRDSAHRG